MVAWPTVQNYTFLYHPSLSQKTQQYRNIPIAGRSREHAIGLLPPGTSHCTMEDTSHLLLICFPLNRSDQGESQTQQWHFHLSILRKAFLGRTALCALLEYSISPPCTRLHCILPYCTNLSKLSAKSRCLPRHLVEWCTDNLQTILSLICLKRPLSINCQNLEPTLSSLQQLATNLKCQNKNRNVNSRNTEETIFCMEPN